MYEMTGTGFAPDTRDFAAILTLICCDCLDNGVYLNA